MRLFSKKPNVKSILKEFKVCCLHADYCDCTDMQVSNRPVIVYA